MCRCHGHRVPETAQYCHKINPSEPEYEIRIFTIQLEDAYSRGLEIACSAFSELSQKFDVIGGKIFAPNLPFSKS